MRFLYIFYILFSFANRRTGGNFVAGSSTRRQMARQFLPQLCEAVLGHLLQSVPRPQWTETHGKHEIIGNLIIRPCSWWFCNCMWTLYFLLFHTQSTEDWHEESHDLTVGRKCRFSFINVHRNYWEVAGYEVTFLCFEHQGTSVIITMKLLIKFNHQYIKHIDKYD